MEKFKVGDRVKCIDPEEHSTLTKNKTYSVVSLWDSFGYSEPQIRVIDNAKIEGGYYNYIFKKLGGSQMSKHEDLKQRIEALDDGWNKDADDILEEMVSSSGGSNGFTYSIEICIWNDNGTPLIRIWENPFNGQLKDKKAVFNEYYKSQCSKLRTFKKALLWLLDHSDIKKVDQKKIDKLEAKLDELKEELAELRG